MKLYKKILRKLKKFIYMPLAKNAPKKIILMVDGGLASQIHKYLIGLYVSEKFNAPVEYDLTWFEKSGKSIDGKDNRLFQLLEVFPNIDFKIASKKDTNIFKACYRYINDDPFTKDEKFDSLKPPIYLDGYYLEADALNEKAAKTLIPIVELEGQNYNFLKAIESHPDSVAIHIRRGDYVNSCHDVLTAEYFARAIEKMNQELAPQKPKYFFFSNGFDWVENDILPLLPQDTDYEFVKNTNDKGYYDFYLMSRCKHQIISNSGFSFYPAFLNNNGDKIVIGPDKWINDNDNSYKNNATIMSFPGMILLPVETN